MNFFPCLASMEMLFLTFSTGVRYSATPSPTFFTEFMTLCMVICLLKSQNRP